MQKSFKYWGRLVIVAVMHHRFELVRDSLRLRKLTSYRSLIALPVIFLSTLLFSLHSSFLLKTFNALNGLLCADVPSRN